QAGAVEGGGHGGNGVAAASAHHAALDPELASLLLERLEAAALPDDEQIGVRELGEDPRPCLEERRVPLLGLEAGNDANDLRPLRHAVLLAQGAARLLVVVSLEVDAAV